MHERRVGISKYTTSVQGVPLLYCMRKKRIFVGISVSKWHSELQAMSTSAGAIVPESRERFRFGEIAKFMEDFK